MRSARRSSEQLGAQSAGRPRSPSRAEPGPERRVPAPAAMPAGPAARTCALLALCLLGSGAQDFGPTRFICTSVPVDADMCAASVAAGGAEELRSNVLQLRETVLQQKETILSQKETIRELTTKLGRCESQSTLDASAGEARAGRGLGSLAELWRSTARPVQWRRAAPDKGSAFLKRRRPLQAAAGMAARPERAGGADGGRGGPSCGPLGVPEGPAARKGFVHRPGNARCASAWPTPFLASVNPGGQQIPLPSNPLLG